MSPQASANPEGRAGTARPVKRAARSKATSAVRLKPRSAATISPGAIARSTPRSFLRPR